MGNLDRLQWAVSALSEEKLGRSAQLLGRSHLDGPPLEVGCWLFVLLPPELLLKLGPKLLVAGLQSLWLDHLNRLDSLSLMTDETNWKVSTANGVSGWVQGCCNSI